MLALMEAPINGVSTRIVSPITEELCGAQFSRSTVSELCSRLDPVQEALDHATQVARRQSEVTKAWIAKRGHASYTGERSMDTYDPGAVAIATMAENLARDWPGD